MGVLAMLAGLSLPVLAAAPARAAAPTPNAYVANQFSDTVSVVDPASNTVTATITGFAAPFGVSITPDGTHAYVTNNGSDTVSVIDTTTIKRGRHCEKQHHHNSRHDKKHKPGSR
ncbi:YncE family protein [Streptomyces sp. NPDC047022]|uniref:YncE family protein n=1 Tax=Streptomyces sp. NPDC047022 TaxID=3155737 RepID=UPI0033E6DE36